MREFAADAAEIFPDAAEDLLDLGCDFSGKAARDWHGRCGAPDSHGPMPAHEAADEVGHAGRARMARIARSTPTEAAERRVGGGLEPAARRDSSGRDHDLRIAPAFKTHDDLAEHLAAFQALQAALEFGERDLGIDHRLHALGHIVEAFADVADRGAERAEDFVLLLEQLHQIDLADRARGRAAGDEPSAALQTKNEPSKVSAPTCSNTTSTPFFA